MSIKSDQALRLNDEQLDILLNDIFETYGYDFLSYSRASIMRRVTRLLSLDRFVSLAEFRYRLRSDPEYLQHFVEQITVNVTEMFRDPGCYQALRDVVLPALADKPLIRIWHAGCSTGEEVYSMAILLREANLLNRSLLYATDINPSVLNNVRAGIFPLNQMKRYSDNYIRSGGSEDFSSYYTAHYDSAKFDERLGERVILATHNLVSDRSFNEFQLIMCRNVMIYFNKDLQNKVLTLFDDSLETDGFIALGSKETLKFATVAKKYRQLENKEKIWKKIRS